MFASLKKQNYFLFELFLFVKLFAMYVSNIAINLLIQDKVCIGFGQNATFCQNIHNVSGADKIIADEVMGETARFTAYKYDGTI